MKSLLKEAWMLAIEALSWMEMQKLSERLALARTAKQLDITNADAMRIAHKLVCETARRRNFIDAFINNALKPKSISEFNFGVQAFLRLYVYQTRVTKNWSTVDIEEAKNVANIARAILGWKTLQQVEHILGLLLTQQSKLGLKNLSDEEKIGFSTFHPTWFVKYCFKLFGRKETIEMLEANMKPPPTYLRINTLKADEDEILTKLAEEGIRLEKVNGLKFTYKLLNVEKPITRTTSYQEGLFYIQDKASCFAAEAADPKPKTVIIDVCAAPGAKTTYLAQLMENRGAIYSVDYSRRRINVWKNEVKHMGVEIATPIIADACNSLPLTVKADLLILDPPCTSTGAFAKLPSAKWRLTRRSIDKMAEIQWQMLNCCVDNIKHGGFLVYSTCSMTVEENEMLIERFLKWHPEFFLVEITPKIGLPGLRGLDKCQRLFPHVHECNGFFIAKLLKNEK